MTKIKTWISAARLRTLPLSIAGILVGTALAIKENAFSWTIFLLAIVTTLSFQILSNFANDYGDGVKGTDNAERIGPARALQSGLLDRKTLKKGVIFMILCSLLSSVLLIYKAFGSANFLHSLLFFVLGLGAIGAAIKYTVGKRAYGYRGLGDIFVFVFFGLVAVVGSKFLYTKTILWTEFLPAITIGLLSVAVLHLNNMRDRLSDTNAGKRTLAVLLGAKQSKKYHYSLIGIALAAMLLYLYSTSSFLWQGLCLIGFIPLFSHLQKVIKNESPALLDPELKKVALSTFFIAVLFLVGETISSF